MPKQGTKTVEFWLTVGLTVITPILNAIWPDAQFPKEAFYAMFVWIAGRATQKYFGLSDASGNPSYKTSEFWTAVIYSIVVAVFPDLPQESFIPVVTYITGRTGIKVKQSIDEKNGK